MFRVANVIARFNSASGGPPRSVAQIAQAGIGHWQANLFSTDYVAPLNDSLLAAHFPGEVDLLNKRSRSAWGVVKVGVGLDPDLKRQISDSLRANVVHLHGLWTPYVAAFGQAARRHGVPYVISPRGMLEPWSLSVHRWRKRLALSTYQGAVLAGASVIHATSDMEAENVHRLGITDAPIIVVPNIVDEPPDIGPFTKVRRQSKQRVLLFLSRLHEKKGIEMLLRAWGQLSPHSWRLLIVGSGLPAYLKQLHRMCATDRIDSVDFQPHVDGLDREAVFARATAFVLPSYSENFGNAVAEALMRGLPVITTTTTPWSVVAEENLGWHVQPELQCLRTALTQLMATQDAELEAMGTRARHYASQNLSRSAVVPRLFDMYRLAIDKVTLVEFYRTSGK